MRAIRCALLEEDAEIVWDVSARDGLTVTLEPANGGEMLMVARDAIPAQQVRRN